METLETIKTWLDTVDILFSEGPMNLKWSNILDKIKNNPEDFIKEGGWSFLHESSDEGGDSDENNEDSNFSASDVEEEESEYSEEIEEYEDSEVSGGDSELSSEGLSWDQLEKQAEKSNILLNLVDREHAQKQIENENTGKRKKR